MSTFQSTPQFLQSNESLSCIHYNQSIEMSSKPSFSNTNNNGKEKCHISKNEIKKVYRYVLCNCRKNSFYHEQRRIHQGS